MKKVNYHLHTTVSDGKLKPEELIKLAIKKKFVAIGITDHYRLPPGFKEGDYAKDNYTKKDYDELRMLQKKYNDKINIFVGVEFDWMEDYKKWVIKETKKRDYDYKFLSIHYFKVDHKYEAIDIFSEKFDDIVKNLGIRKLAEGYYRSLRQGIETRCFDIVAHLDLIKMFNKNNKYFSGKEKWYQNEVGRTLELIKKKNMKIELNTSGWRRDCNEQYPAEWILKKAVKLKIPVIIGTDGHRKEQLEFGLKKAENLLDRLK
jgi:histidinol-phosphatase (PHP family)